jgi:hypothetical protein
MVGRIFTWIKWLACACLRMMVALTETAPGILLAWMKHWEVVGCANSWCNKCDGIECDVWHIYCPINREMTQVDFFCKKHTPVYQISLQHPPLCKFCPWKHTNLHCTSQHAQVLNQPPTNNNMLTHETLICTITYTNQSTHTPIGLLVTSCTPNCFPPLTPVFCL